MLRFHLMIGNRGTDAGIVNRQMSQSVGFSPKTLRQRAGSSKSHFPAAFQLWDSVNYLRDSSHDFLQCFFFFPLSFSTPTTPTLSIGNRALRRNHHEESPLNTFLALSPSITLFLWL
ncbi:hypothetical protein CDAR_290421 [Caerostris darwini]|uniref:Uncharacterized protein n=1 Tax=Caerostris darwini TaxID=1538125 RepID=A0AAV4N5D7_9ARAC|nr:hypothetical protein CDAR_290421 [Caerostris darwini]